MFNFIIRLIALGLNSRPSGMLFLACISTHNLFGFYDALAALAVWNLAML